MNRYLMVQGWWFTISMFNIDTALIQGFRIPNHWNTFKPFQRFITSQQILNDLSEQIIAAKPPSSHPQNGSDLVQESPPSQNINNPLNSGLGTTVQQFFPRFLWSKNFWMVATHNYFLECSPRKVGEGRFPNLTCAYASNGLKGSTCRFPCLSMRCDSLKAFSFTTGNDQEDRDPIQWILEGSLHGVSGRFLFWR